MSTIYDLFQYSNAFQHPTSVPTLIASVGLILATSSFISGLQLVKGTSVTLEGKIHRFNGVSSIIIYATLFILSMIQGGLSWTIIGWVSGALVIALQGLHSKAQKAAHLQIRKLARRHAYAHLVYVVYAHMPV